MSVGAECAELKQETAVLKMINWLTKILVNQFCYVTFAT